MTSQALWGFQKLHLCYSFIRIIQIEDVCYIFNILIKHSTFNLGFGILQIFKVTGIGNITFVQVLLSPLITPLFWFTWISPLASLLNSQVPAWDSICIWKTHMNLQSSLCAVPYDSKPSIRLDTRQIADRWCTHHYFCYQHHGRHYSPQVDLMTDNIKIVVTSKYIC